MRIFIFIIISTIGHISFGQSVKIHVQKDFHQKVPFWNSYTSGVSSVGIDVFHKDGQLFVAESQTEVLEGRTLENLYFKPLQSLLHLNSGDTQSVVLNIDIKTEIYSTLNTLTNILEKYPSVKNSARVKFHIGGNTPSPEEYKKYPENILFIHHGAEISQHDNWNKVALVNVDFIDVSHWRGKGKLVDTEKAKIEKVIAKAHRYGKPIRFLGAPDNMRAWRALAKLGVDYITTASPKACAGFINSLSARTYTNAVFSDVYQPSFLNDQKAAKVNNVILLIGDGYGLTQVSAAAFANNGSLTLTQLKSIGLVKTQSSNDFTTDSGAAATAMATGKKTNNRAIGVDNQNKNVENITEILHKLGYSTGLISTDNITSATPSAFYAHQQTRDNVAAIANDLLKSDINFFAGGGKNRFSDFGDFKILDSISEIGVSSCERIGYFMSENGVSGVLQGRGNLLAEVTKQGLTYLENKNKPFFLMVEGGLIDAFGHRNDVGGTVSESIDFDRAITEAIKFADKTPGTLVIITADHETSGFSIPYGDINKNQIEGNFGTTDHTGAMTPLFAYGPNSNEFIGVYDINEIFHKIISLLEQSKM